MIDDSPNVLNMMDELNEQLDQTILDIFQVLEDLFAKQAELEQTMKDGYFSMARARYSMGMTRVSADQILDADLVANLTVKTETTLDSESIEVRNKNDLREEVFDKTDNIFHLCQEKCSQGDKANNKNKSDSLSKEIEDGVRKRVKGIMSGDEVKGNKENDTVKKNEGIKVKLNNPINLFGVLVPQHLRSCQNSFEGAVKISVDIANMKHKLSALKKKLNSLKNKKSELSRCDESTPCVET